MDKEDNLFEDQIEEDDLLNISLDDLSAVGIEEAVDEEPDEDIIELMDLLEKGDDSLLGIGDEIDTVSEDKMSFEETVETPAIDTESLSDLEPDEILGDSGLSDLDADLEPEQSTEEEFGQFLTEDSLDIEDIGTEDVDIGGDELESLLGETEPESYSNDTETLSDETEDLDLEMEDFSDLEAVLNEEGLLSDGISDVSADENNQDSLFEDIDLETESEEELIDIDDELPGASDSEFGKTIVSSEENVSGEEPLWEMDNQDQMRSSGLEFEDIDGEIAVDENQLEAADDTLPDDEPVDDTLPDDEPVDELFPDDEPVDELFPDEGLHDAEEIADESRSVDIHEMYSSEEDQKEVTDEGTETQIYAEADVEDTPVPDDSGLKMDMPAAVSPQPLISEEKIEEIVRSVVGDVVERIAREVFTEVAEKVITQAIDSLKESLE